MAILLAGMFCSTWAGEPDDGTDNGIKHRVATLEEATLQQQDQIDMIGEWIGDFETNNPQDLRIMSANNEQLGQFLGFHSHRLHASSLMEVNEYRFVVRMDRNNIWWDAHLNFTDQSCSSEDVYIAMDQLQDFWMGFEPTVLVVNHFDPGSRVPYIQTSDPHERLIGSFLTPHGCATHEPPQPMPVMPVEPLIDGQVYDLSQIYEPPYRLE